jgi:hypothetical protein
VYTLPAVWPALFGSSGYALRRLQWAMRLAAGGKLKPIRQWKIAKQAGAHHGGRVTTHNSPSPGAAGVQQRCAAVQTVPPAAVSCAGGSVQATDQFACAVSGLTRAIKWKRRRILKIESHLRSAPVAASTLSGKRRPGAEGIMSCGAPGSCRPRRLQRARSRLGPWHGSDRGDRGARLSLHALMAWS